jgi:hypothetical protein
MAPWDELYQDAVVGQRLQLLNSFWCGAAALALNSTAVTLIQQLPVVASMCTVLVQLFTG